LSLVADNNMVISPYFCMESYECGLVKRFPCCSAEMPKLCTSAECCSPGKRVLDSRITGTCAGSPRLAHGSHAESADLTKLPTGSGCRGQPSRTAKSDSQV